MKKQLIDLMIEAGVKWPDGAEYAAQDKNSNDLCFYKNEPCHNSRYSEEWRPSESDHPHGIVGHRVTLPSLCAKWRTTLVTREQYEKALVERSPAQPIEVRIASLRALEKQVEETRAELTRDLEALGLTWMVRDEPTITDWRDLRVGDVIWWEGDYRNSSGEYTVVDLQGANYNGNMPIVVSDGGWVNISVEQWRFIRRP